MKVGLFGGSFDPIHAGHIDVGHYILTQEIVDEIWYMPCYVSLYNKKMAAPLHRLEMIERALQGETEMFAFDFEIKHKLQTGSYDIMKLIQLNYPEVDFYFIIGQDNANKMTFWLHPEEIIKEFKFIVIPRSGYPQMDDAWYEQGNHYYLKEAELDMPISSTMIRKQLKGIMKPRFLSQQVFDYINEYGLYSDRYN